MISKDGGRVNNSLRAKSKMRWYEHLWFIQYGGMRWQLAQSFRDATPFMYNIAVLPFMIFAFIPYSFYAVHKARKGMKKYES